MLPAHLTPIETHQNTMHCKTQGSRLNVFILLTNLVIIYFILLLCIFHIVSLLKIKETSINTTVGRWIWSSFREILLYKFYVIQLLWSYNVCVCLWRYERRNANSQYLIQNTHQQGRSKKGIHVYFLLIVAMVLLLSRQIVLLRHQVTMVASKQHLYQTIVLPRKLSTGSNNGQFFSCCPVVGILFEVLRITAINEYLFSHHQYCFNGHMSIIIITISF